MVKNLLGFDSQLCVISKSTCTTPEKHFCLMNTSFSVFSVHIFLHLYLNGFWKHVSRFFKKKQKNNVIPDFFLYCCRRCNRTWPVGAYCQQPKFVRLLCGNPTSQAFNSSFWMSCSDFTWCHFLCTVCSHQDELVWILFTPALWGAANFLNTCRSSCAVNNELS